MNRPSHPGDIIASRLQAKHISVQAVEMEHNIRLTEVIEGRAPIVYKVACALRRTGIGPESYWLSLQSSYERQLGRFEAMSGHRDWLRRDWVVQEIRSAYRVSSEGTERATVLAVAGLLYINEREVTS